MIFAKIIELTDNGLETVPNNIHLMQGADKC